MDRGRGGYGETRGRSKELTERLTDCMIALWHISTSGYIASQTVNIKCCLLKVINSLAAEFYF